MKIGKIVLASVILTGLNASESYAGFKGLTIHSRANCMSINESIAWDFTAPLTLWTASTHMKMNNANDWHKNWTGWETTKRNAVVHWTEAPPGVGWQVYGEHWMFQNGNIIVLGSELISDCSLYNGWWDYNL